MHSLKLSRNFLLELISVKKAIPLATWYSRINSLNRKTRPRLWQELDKILHVWRKARTADDQIQLKRSVSNDVQT